MKIKSVDILLALIILISQFPHLKQLPPGIRSADPAPAAAVSNVTKLRIQAVEKGVLPATARDSSPAATSAYSYTRSSASQQTLYISQDDLDEKPFDLKSHQELTEFVRSVRSEKRKGLLVGIYAPDVFTAPIVQQPANNGMYVSRNPDKITQFRRANSLGTIGLLAHNYLMGQYFFNLGIEDELYVVKWDGSYQKYKVYAIEDYRVISGTSYRSLLTGKTIDQYGLLYHIYRGSKDKLVLQTCIEKNGDKDWGRRFVLAKLAANP
jgi:hypothetical protein